MYQELSNVAVTTADTSMVTGDYTWVASDNTLLNVRAGWWDRDQKIDSRTGSDEEASARRHLPGPGPELRWDLLVFSSRKEDSTQVDVELTQYADNFIAGNHEFKFGVQYSSGSIEIGAANSSFWWKQPPSAAFYWYDYWAFRFQIMPPIIYGADSTTKGAFASDTWQINDKWTIDLGVRYDDQKGSIPSYPRLDTDGNPTDEMLPSADMVDWQNWAPRLGFAWNPRGDGRTVHPRFRRALLGRTGVGVVVLPATRTCEHGAALGVSVAVPPPDLVRSGDTVGGAAPSRRGKPPHLAVCAVIRPADRR